MRTRCNDKGLKTEAKTHVEMARDLAGSTSLTTKDSCKSTALNRWIYRDALKQERRLASIACSGCQPPTHLSEKIQRARSYCPQSFERDWYKKTPGKTGIRSLFPRDGKFRCASGGLSKRIIILSSSSLCTVCLRAQCWRSVIWWHCETKPRCTRRWTHGAASFTATSLRSISGTCSQITAALWQSTTRTTAATQHHQSMVRSKVWCCAWHRLGLATVSTRWPIRIKQQSRSIC